MTNNADNPSRGRMLLSHNFALSKSDVHPLNREQFAAVFSQGLTGQTGIDCSPIDNPHWIVEVRYDTGQYSPQDIGQRCADTLATYRRTDKKEDFYIMALGGEKTTPATSGPPSLQPGEWGVDVVETASPEEFLAELNWDKLAGAKPSSEIFRIDQPV
jgi:Protein of unknown function (DUF2656)